MSAFGPLCIAFPAGTYEVRIAGTAKLLELRMKTLEDEKVGSRRIHAPEVCVRERVLLEKPSHRKPEGSRVLILARTPPRVSSGFYFLRFDDLGVSGSFKSCVELVVRVIDFLAIS